MKRVVLIYLGGMAVMFFPSLLFVLEILLRSLGVHTLDFLFQPEPVILGFLFIAAGSLMMHSQRDRIEEVKKRIQVCSEVPLD